MKLVIDIPYEEYNVILANADFYKEKNWGSSIVWDAIVNGIPLPKGYGELIDKDAVLNMMNHGILVKAVKKNDN